MAGQVPVMPSFDEFVAARLGALRSYAHLLAGDEAAAVGLVDEALVRTGLAWSRVTKDGDPEAYVRATVVALYLSRWRPRSRVGATGADDQQAAATRSELAAHLRPALHRLPQRLRTGARPPLCRRPARLGGRAAARLQRAQGPLGRGGGRCQARAGDLTPRPSRTDAVNLASGVPG
jgi:hypothetical protein